MKKCPEGWRLFICWTEVAALVLGEHQATGLIGKELEKAQENDQRYQQAFQVYTAHLRTCGECIHHFRAVPE